MNKTLLLIMLLAGSTLIVQASEQTPEHTLSPENAAKLEREVTQMKTTIAQKIAAVQANAELSEDQKKSQTASLNQRLTIWLKARTELMISYDKASTPLKAIIKQHEESSAAYNKTKAQEHKNN